MEVAPNVVYLLLGHAFRALRDNSPRLKLTLITKAERGSEEFKWIHEVRSNVQSTWWSLYGPSKSPADTEQALQNMIARPHVEGGEKVHRYPYAVHQLLEESTTRFIGLITLRTLSSEECKFPPRNDHESTATTLSLELAYMFLPTSWGQGFATESITAVLKSIESTPTILWAPHKKLIVRAIVNDENVPSRRVMEKCGMGVPEVLEFEGGRFLIAGKWRTKHRLFVFAKELVV
ncbi:hypothetical protein HBH78_201940 [Parastagonospora nodorum]|nr:hypothetical protein HBH78_201940 [Parastagonospora nodorum]KAH4760307.1 hypothetical protein HBH63_213380 [Parastagonospora nodorum]KAH4770735.1 hypothetical protein HBH62_215980 [Parastagonospora nodorum]